MNKITLSIIFVSFISILSIPIIIGQQGVIIDQDLKDELITKGIGSWGYQDHIGDDEMYRCLVSPNDYNLPCSEKFLTYWVNCTEYNVTLIESYDCQIEKTNCSIDTLCEYENESICEDLGLYSTVETCNEETVCVTVTIGNISECINEERINYTSFEKESVLNNWEIERMEQIARAIKDRRERIKINITGEGYRL